MWGTISYLVNIDEALISKFINKISMHYIIYLPIICKHAYTLEIVKFKGIQFRDLNDYRGTTFSRNS